MEKIRTKQLPNGIILAHLENYHTRIMHTALTLDVGSRDEEEHEYGIAHFWEHMVFKGTKKRKAFHILNRLESHGGELNAYTTKEKICLYSSVLHTYVDQAVELLSDITFNSVFPEKQLEIERHVILEEMAMYRDSPEDAIQDDFEEIVFQRHSLGANILGTEDTIASLSRDHFHRFMQANLSTDRIVFSSVGPISFEKMERIALRYFGEIPSRFVSKQKKTFCAYQAQVVKRDKPISQAHVGLGNIAYPLNHNKRLTFFMVTNLLGGPGMNSRLNLALREKYGFVYSIEAQYTPYSDTGLFAIYFGTDKHQVKRTVNLVRKELNQLKKPLGNMQLMRAKDQLKGQLAMAEESNLGYALMMGKSLLDYNKIFTLEEVFKQIEEVSKDDIIEVSTEVFDPDKLSILTFCPTG